MNSGHFTPASSLEVYDPATDHWTVVAEELPEVPPSMRMLAYNNRLLFFGVDKQQDGRANFVLFDPNPLAAPTPVAAINFGGQSRSGEKYAETARMLMRRDIDKDGKLSIDELGSKLSHLLAGDQDGDSALSLEELKGPGYSADAFIDRETGQYTLSEITTGTVSVLNDLHKGRDAGAAWAWVIDISAAVMIMMSLSGFGLLFYIKKRRVTGVLTAVVGTVLLLVVWALWVP